MFDTSSGHRPAKLADSGLCLAKDRRSALHDCRHTFGSFGIAAGWNPKTLQTYMGHSSIQVTYDVYGHLFPGSEAEAAAQLDDYLSRVGAAKRPAVG